MSLPKDLPDTTHLTTAHERVNSKDAIEHIDLALSGGGFRATLFHLGVIGFLRSEGLLGKVSNICSVSGGSILAAHMKTRWHEYTDPDDDVFIQAAEHLINAIQQRDVTGRALIHFGSLYRLFRRKALNSELLVEEYRLILGSTKKTVDDSTGESGSREDERITRWEDLTEDRPNLHLLATHISTATMFVFNRKRFSVFRSLDKKDSNPEIDALIQFAKGLKVGSEEIARAVAASSAFPPIFAPLSAVKGDLPKLQLLTDGGVYDNSGVKYLRELYETENFAPHQRRLVILSDAGRAFSSMLGKEFDTIIELATRVSDAQGNRIAEFDSDQAQAFFKRHDVPTLRCSIHEKIEGGWLPPKNSKSAKSNHSAIVQERIGKIRTELDKFSDIEVFALYRHGYSIARKAFLSSVQGATPAWNAETWFPHGKSLNASKREDLEDGLRDSHKMRKLASLRNVAIPLAAIIILVTLFGASVLGFIAGGGNKQIPDKAPTDSPASVDHNFGPDTGTHYKIESVFRSELELRPSSDFVQDVSNKWPFAYGSGVVYHKQIEGKYVFYMITDRGPAFDGPKTPDEKSLKLYLDRNFVPRIAKVEMRSLQSQPKVIESYQLQMDGSAVEGVPPTTRAGEELAVAFTKGNSFQVLPSVRFGIDPEDLALSPGFEDDSTFWICEEYRPSVMKAVLTPNGVVEIQNKILLPGDGLPEEFEQARANRGIESISIKDGWLFVAMQGAFNKDPKVDGHILIARALLSEVDEFVKNSKQFQWEVYKYVIPSYYTLLGSECSINGITAIDKDHLLVLERQVDITSRHRTIKLVNLQAVTADRLVRPEDFLDLSKIGWVSEKPEGISLIDSRTLVVSADNDFGMLLQGGIEVSVQQKPPHQNNSLLPITDMKFFQAVNQSPTEYRVECKIDQLKERSLSLGPLVRTEERNPAFWVIRMTDSLLNSK